MKFTGNLSVSGYQIKEVGFPTEHNDAINRAYLESKIACWEGKRYYCLDAVNGDDNRLGYSDKDSSEAYRCSIKSAEKLSSVIPRIGSGASLSIAIHLGTYQNLNLSLMDYDSVLIYTFGWNILGKYYCLEMNSSGDQIRLGNENGSNTDLSQINFSQSRIRFGLDTITSSLRNISSDLYSHEDLAKYSIIHLKELPKARTCAEDYLYIEQPGAKFNSFNLDVWTFNKCNVSGILGINGFNVNNPLNKSDISFCYGPGIIKT